uniref:Uncharacterized protein n=2 Tax=Myzomyia TaxID=59140 RepID=A0A182MLT5_9DIPT
MNLEPINSALSQLRVLRSSVGQVFETLGTGVRADHGEEGKEQKFLQELQELLNSVNANLKDFESCINDLTPSQTPLNLANSAYLSLETNLERQALYPHLVQSYKWHDKLHEYSTFASTLLQQNSLKRSYYTNTKRRRSLPSSHLATPQMVENLIGSIHYNNMNLKIARPFMTNAILHITIARVLRAAVILKGLLIEWVTVKGYEESLLDGVDEQWTESRHQVFRKVQDHAHSAMLHFFSPTLPELAIRSFITWFRSYVTLFADPCKKCGKHLHNTLPPTWRDLRTLEPFHEECKQ